MTIGITGGAGFIGSHLADYYMQKGESVRILDNLSAGSIEHLNTWIDNEQFTFIKGDLLKPNSTTDFLNDIEIIYHLAANPEVRSWKASPTDHFRQNIESTFNLLETIRKKGDVKVFVFASTSTVYGEPLTIPTSETYAPLKPISTYGASKLAAEALISSYSSMYGFQGIIYRLANVVGPRTNHGVVYDFINKLRTDEHYLEVLGDGLQSKSYLYVNDCIEGMVLGVEKSEESVEILNIGSEDRVNVMKTAEIIIEEMKLDNVKISLTGGVEGGRGWKGDVKLMQLDMSRLKSLGWKPKYNSSESIRETARYLINTL